MKEKITSVKSAIQLDHPPLIYPKSIIAFMDTFNTDEKCLNYIAQLKWPDGWLCPRCGANRFCFIKTRGLIRCKYCGDDESFIANTVMRKTRKPLRYWFWAIYTLATQKTGLSAMELYRQLGFKSYETAWAWLHKIRMAMVNPDRTELSGEIEVDETYIGTGTKGKGRKLGGEKAVVICAVEMKPSSRGRPASGRIRLRHLSSASAQDIHPFVIDHIEQGTTIYTDGWMGYRGLRRYGYKHIIEPVGSPEEASKKFPRVHRIFSNLKAWLIGTHRFVSLKHMQNYLNEYTFRFNRRRNPKLAFNTLLKIAVSMPARPYEEFVKPAEPFYINPEEKLEQLKFVLGGRS